MVTRISVNLMLFCRQLNPVASDDLRVRHEPDLEVDVGLESRVRDVIEVWKVDFPLLQKSLGRSNQLGHGQGDLDERDHLVTLQTK